MDLDWQRGPKHDKRVTNTTFTPKLIFGGSSLSQLICELSSRHIDLSGNKKPPVGKPSEELWTGQPESAVVLKLQKGAPQLYKVWVLYSFIPKKTK